MFKQEHLEDFIENRDAHEDYYTVMDEYSGTELFEEITHFMDIKHPYWKTNKGLGFWAAEFVYSAIQNNEYLLDRDEYSFKYMLENIYKELDYDYERMKSNFDMVYNNILLTDFENHHEDELEDNNHLSEEEYSKFYDNLFKAFKKEHLKIVTYNFEDDLIFS